MSAELAVLTQIKNTKQLSKVERLFSTQFGSGNVQYIFRLGSSNWVSPITGKVRVTCLAGGGSGAATSNNVNGAKATGGGGGGCAIGEFDVVAGTSYPIVIGAGGAAITISAASITTNGNAGGTTSWNGVMSALGGAGGISNLGDTAVTALGGSASGSFISKIDGGDSGSVLAHTGSVNQCAGGGGASGIFLSLGLTKAGNGGNITFAASQYSASGGGSPTSNAITCTYNNVNSFAGGAAGYFTTGTNTLGSIASLLIGVAGAGAVPTAFSNGLGDFVVGTSNIEYSIGDTSTSAYEVGLHNGASSGVLSHGAGLIVANRSPIAAPLFGGGGLYGSLTTGTSQAGSASLGGGGGGLVSNNITGTVIGKSGAGGNGMIVIEY